MSALGWTRRLVQTEVASGVWLRGEVSTKRAAACACLIHQHSLAHVGCIAGPEAPDDRVTEAGLAPVVRHRRDFAAFGVVEPPAIVEVRQLS